MPFFDFYFFKNFVVNYFYFKTFLNLLFKYIGIKKSAFKSMLVISFKTLKDINRETLLKVYKLYPIIKNRAIIDNDNRVVLEDYQYMQKPYRSICRILISFNELSGVAYQGTGFLVGPHTILTNCLMVYDCSNEHNYGWFDSISISFGTYKDSNGNASNVNTYKFDHNCDTAGGASGSPVIKNRII